MKTIPRSVSVSRQVASRSTLTSNTGSVRSTSVPRSVRPARTNPTISVTGEIIR